MAAKQTRRKKRWMLWLGLVFLAVGIMFLWMLYLGKTFILPTKRQPALAVSAEPVMNRDKFVWMPPTEPEPEQEEVHETYQLQIDMNSVRSYHDSNHDVAGWVRIQDTVINYPIMQTDNNSFYTDHNWLGQHSHAGAIFADWRCSLDKTDNALLYGHNLANGTMLHAIKNYKVADWGNSHPYIEVASLTHRYLYKVLSVNVLYGELGANFEYWNTIDMNRSAYRNYLNNIRNSAQVWYGDDTALPCDGKDRLIALQTCNSGANDGMRCVVFAQCIGDFTDTDTYDPDYVPPEERIALKEWIDR
ncbi:MAG: class B sortase [Oscillospiraceae bacterium]|nr:class B sortase [Oscillospiraceae bacterium]